jgi:hypothetical protein
LRNFIDEIIDAAEFLNYLATEGELVDRILMNLHPDVLAQSAFLPRPSSLQELRKLSGHIEEKLAVQAERQRVDLARGMTSGAEPVFREAAMSHGGLSSRESTSRRYPKC